VDELDCELKQVYDDFDRLKIDQASAVNQLETKEKYLEENARDIEMLTQDNSAL
jgi:hypothetical protein